MEKSIDTLLVEGRYSLWHPTSKGDLLMDYPELRKVPQFVEVNNPRKMLFVWFYACKTSRAMELHDDSDRIRYAMMAAWKNRIPKDVEEEYPKKKWGSQVTAAIDVMRSYNPESRIWMAKVASDQMEAVKTMLEGGAEDLVGWKAKNEYFDAVKDGMALMEQLRPLTEYAALGVVVKTKEQENEEGSIMERLHNMSVE